jgi:predicted transcriptional regulator
MPADTIADNTTGAVLRPPHQVLPAIAHPANASGFLLADDAAWLEHATAGYVFTDAKTLATLSSRFDTLRGECYRVSESTALFVVHGTCSRPDLIRSLV